MNQICFWSQDISNFERLLIKFDDFPTLVNLCVKVECKTNFFVKLLFKKSTLILVIDEFDK